MVLLSSDHQRGFKQRLQGSNSVTLGVQIIWATVELFVGRSSGCLMSYNSTFPTLALECEDAPCTPFAHGFYDGAKIREPVWRYLRTVKEVLGSLNVWP